MRMKDDNKPWERQKGESEQAFEAFSIYRDMGESRTFQAVADKLQKSYTLIRRWKCKWDWEIRVTAYDNDLEKQAFREKRKLVADTRKRQLQIAMQLEKKALEALNTVDPEGMSPRDIKELLRLATDIERNVLLNDANATATPAAQTSLADTIIAAYEKRMGGEDE